MITDADAPASSGLVAHDQTAAGAAERDTSDAAPPAPTPVSTVDGASTVAAPQADLKWDSVLVLARGAIPDGEKRPVIVVEDTGSSKKTYPENAAVYLRFIPTLPADPENGLPARAGEPIDFKTDSPVYTLGDGLIQGQIGSLSPRRGIVTVFPPIPAYAALSIAYAEGAKKIELAGLTDEEKERVQPMIDRIHADAVKTGDQDPLIREGTKITLS